MCGKYKYLHNFQGFEEADVEAAKKKKEKKKGS